MDKLEVKIDATLYVEELIEIYNYILLFGLALSRENIIVLIDR